jgi:hypothetical protein
MAKPQPYKDYEINEKDIDSVLNYLRIFDPEHATPENAIDFIEYLRTGVHEIAHNSPERLEELYAAFTKQKSEKQ